MKIKQFAILAMISGVAFQSCGSEEASTENEGQEVTTSTETETVIMEQEEESEYTFIPPSPLQIASIFKKAGLEYNPMLLNNPDNVSNYTDKFRQSVNFGVYSSDLAYCVKNEKYDEAGKYLKTLKELSGDIGLETVFASEDLVERFNANIGNQDSIVDILIFVQENTDDYIAQNGKVELSVVYYAGAWVEGMSFGANAAKANQSDMSLGNLLSEQMTIGRSIHKGLVTLNADDIDAQDLADSIKEILDMFDNFESVKALGEDAAYLDIYLTEEEIGLISDAIIELRSSIVE